MKTNKKVEKSKILKVEKSESRKVETSKIEKSNNRMILYLLSPSTNMIYYLIIYLFIHLLFNYLFILYQQTPDRPQSGN